MKRYLVDQFAACAVYEDRGRFHLGQRFGVDDVVGRLGVWCMDRDDVRFGPEFVEVYELHAVEVGSRLICVRIERDDASWSKA